MGNGITNNSIAFRLWFFTWLTFSAGVFIISLFVIPEASLGVLGGTAIGSCIGSLPALLILCLSMQFINKNLYEVREKFVLLLLVQLSICICYGLIASFLTTSYLLSFEGLKAIAIVTGVLFACNCISTVINLTPLKIHFSKTIHLLSLPKLIADEQHYAEYEDIATAVTEPNQSIISKNQNNNYMQHNPQEYTVANEPAANTTANKILIKGIITGVLILVMLIPTIFITNLVQEREQRQKEVVAEVSNKWAKAQTITGPYLLVPYHEEVVNEENKKVLTTKTVVLLPENLEVNGDIAAEQRPRSIYKVLLYKSNINAKGAFNIKIPQNIIPANLQLSEARLCVGINDFKGIEGPLTVNFNGTSYDLTAGLPSHEIDSNGLSSPVALNAEDFNHNIPFALQLKIKGSEQLSFVPLSGNSKFTLQSSWPSPSFDGNTLPNERTVSEKGFTAKWSFNKATLPYGTFTKDFTIDKGSFAFGVSMLQPADQYAKTMRSVKYAILFIGLTFSLFFIVELLQKKPVHPVQYILVGLALVIFYSLLLSFSEFILFDFAYLVAATATVTLITLYAKGHFQSWKTASVFASVLGALYGFIFVLIRLEDTALLVGSIGLFLVLALVMYASRRINWYHPSLTHDAAEVA